jgi:hypothetical protein
MFPKTYIRQTLGLHDDTEKAIFVMFVVNECLQRLAIMRMTGKGDPASVLKRLPKFNGDDYYFFHNFNYPYSTGLGIRKSSPITRATSEVFTMRC